MRAAAHPIVFFDIDETLIDQRRAERHAAVIFWEHHRDRLPDCAAPLDLAAKWRALREKHAPRYLNGEISHAQQRRLRVRELFNTSTAHLNDTEADAIFAAFFERYRAAWRIFHDVTPCLAALRGAGWRLGVISNGEGDQQRDKLRAAGIADAFDLIVISGERGIAKPRAQIFHDACRLADVAAHNTIHIGDRHDCDAQAAIAAGLRGVWLDRLGLANLNGCPRVTSLSEVPMLLSGASPRCISAER